VFSSILEVLVHVDICANPPYIRFCLILNDLKEAYITVPR